MSQSVAQKRDTAAPLLVAEDLKRHYAVRRGFLQLPAIVRAVDGIRFQLEPRRTLAVVGESGCGKSTLARMVTMIETPTAGRLEIDGINTDDASGEQRKVLRCDVQFVFQNPYASLNPRWTIGTTLAEPLKVNTNLSALQRRERVADMMAKVGLRPEWRERYPHMFSGGQRQRIAIARALMLQPKILVADEPVSALDVSVQAQALNLMMDLQAEFGFAMLFISHDLSVVRHISHDVLVMYLGRPMEQGPKEAIFTQPMHPYTQVLFAATPSVEPVDRPRTALKGELPSPLNPPSGCVFRTRCPYARERCAAEVPAFRPVAGRHVACHFAEEIAEHGSAFQTQLA